MPRSSKPKKQAKKKRAARPNGPRATASVRIVNANPATAPPPMALTYGLGGSTIRLDAVANQMAVALDRLNVAQSSARAAEATRQIPQPPSMPFLPPNLQEPIVPAAPAPAPVDQQQQASGWASETPQMDAPPGLDPQDHESFANWRSRSKASTSSDPNSLLTAFKAHKRSVKAAQTRKLNLGYQMEVATDTPKRKK